MRGDRNNSDLVFVGPVVPENSISSRSGLLSIGFKDLFSFRSAEAGEFVGFKAFMSWIL